MSTITNTVHIKATPADVWAVLADLPATRQWLPGVVSARMEGTLRVCEMADGQEVHERISELSHERRTLRFEHVRVPLPVRRSAGVFTVGAGPTSDTSTVTLQTTVEPLETAATAELTGMIRDAFQQSLESLRRFVEDKVRWDATAQRQPGIESPRLKF